MHPHRKREIRLLVSVQLPQFVPIDAELDACAGYVRRVTHGEIADRIG